MKILCNVSDCQEMFDSVLQLREHRLSDHYQHYFELADGDVRLLQRFMEVLRE